jgi:hypothetical protein
VVEHLPSKWKAKLKPQYHIKESKGGREEGKEEGMLKS